MENRLKQRYWVLLSSKKTPVLSSLIAREKKPKQGEWMEVSIRPCCSLKVAVGTYSSSPIFTINCGSEKVLVSLSDVADTDAAVEELNTNYSALGTWSSDGDFFYLEGVFCPNSSLELSYD